MPSPPSSPDPIQIDNSKKNTTKKKNKKKSTPIPKPPTTLTTNNNTSSSTTKQQQPPPSGSRMLLRDATQRRRPGRYREADEIPDTRPAWVHPPVAFNADLARFVAPYSLPMDAPAGFSPSRERYLAWLEEEEKKRVMGRSKGGEEEDEDGSPVREEEEDEEVSVKLRPEVLSGRSTGPNVVHLPPLSEQRRRGEQQERGFPDDDDSEGEGVRVSDRDDDAENGGGGEFMVSE